MMNQGQSRSNGAPIARNGHPLPEKTLATSPGRNKRMGMAIIGLGGAVATTAVAGIELLRAGAVGTEGLPLASLSPELTEELVPYENLVFGGWDLCADDLSQAAKTHRVLTDHQLYSTSEQLSAIRPWPAVGNAAFCHNIGVKHAISAPDHREAIRIVQNDLRRFQSEQNLASVVVVNLASTECTVEKSKDLFQTLAGFEKALDDNSPDIGPAMIYAYASLREGMPFANFTPSVAVDLPALVELAEQQNVPVCGKDGKTGQTMIKTVLAPAFRTRALKVDGWYSTNILGNRDGLALDDKDSLASKRATKGSVLDQILGYKVDDHLVDIRYYRPRLDNKESWDNIDITGFLGQQMQLKVNFLCRDSILAAPLAIELARLLDYAQEQGKGGVQEQLGVFFKAPMMSRDSDVPEHALHLQQENLLDWLRSASHSGPLELDEALMQSTGD